MNFQGDKGPDIYKGDGNDDTSKVEKGDLIDHHDGQLLEATADDKTPPSADEAHDIEHDEVDDK